MSRPWQPSTTLQLSLVAHVGAGATLAFAPGLWPAALALLLANHGVLVTAGLLPRSRLLGPNLTRLPAAAMARREIALTIDDGPDPEVTPRVLDLLDAAGAKASFFCIGALAARHPALVRDIAARGHSVENHSQNHLKRFSILSPGAMQREIAAAQDSLATITGRLPNFFRPTAGLRNPFLEPILAHFDLQLASWTRRAYDTRCGDPRRIHERLARGLAAGDILLLHDGHTALTAGGRPVLLEALPPLLQSLRAGGLQAVTLPAALGLPAAKAAAGKPFPLC